MTNILEELKKEVQTAIKMGNRPYAHCVLGEMIMALKLNAISIDEYIDIKADLDECLEI